jgi:hypothetical protein
MIEILQNLKGIGDDGVRFLPLHVTDKADAAGVMLVSRIVETLSGGETGVVHWWGWREKRRCSLPAAACGLDGKGGGI